MSETEALHRMVLASLDDDQAVETISIPLAGKTSIADYMVIASGRSTRQVASMAQKLAERIKAETGLTTIAVGLITEAQQAEAILAEGKADAISLARAMLYDPRWPWHAAAELGAQVRAPKQYWRSQPREYKDLFKDTAFGQR